MEFRSLRRDEIEQIWTINRREFIARTYGVQDGELVPSHMQRYAGPYEPASWRVR